MADRTSLKRPRPYLKVERSWKDQEREGRDELSRTKIASDSARMESKTRVEPRRRCHIPTPTLLLVLILSRHWQICTAFEHWQGRVAKGTSLGTSIKNQQQLGLQGTPLSSSVMFNYSEFQTPKDIDVSSPPYPRQDNDMEEEDETVENNLNTAPPSLPTSVGMDQMTRQSGNPIVDKTVPVDVQITLSVEPEADIEFLVQDMGEFLEHYLEKQFQQLIDFQQDKFAMATPIVTLQNVNLSVLLADESSRRTRSLRTTAWGKLSSSRPLLRSPNHDLKSRFLQESSRLATINVNGEVAYSVEVDGGLPTPIDIDQEWNAALAEFMSQPRLDEAVSNACVDGVVRVDQVDSLTLQNSPREPSEATTTTVISTNVANNPATGDGTIPWQGQSPNTTSSELTRPSTLSIIFGFFLTGIAALGLVGYCYIFYRKRKKRLRKKRQMKESISFPARNTSVGSAPPTTRQSSSLGPPPMLPVVASPIILTPIDETFSEDTSYKGLESSIGSEDASDAFAKELHKAASLDQQAWEEFQKRKEVLNRSQVTHDLEVEKPQNPSKESVKITGQKREIPPPLLGQHNISSDEEGMVDYPEGVEADLQGQPSFARSFPYGDETANDADDEWIENPMTPRSQRYQIPEKQWEPYTSALPPSPDTISMEEKKDEISPSGFFAKELQNIEMDLARYDGNPSMDETGSDDDVLSNVDMMSEVEELSKFVRRYEQRKDRKMKREMDINGRQSMGGTSSVGTSSMSIGMDGRVYNPYQSSPNLEPSTPSSASTMSSLAPPPGNARGSDLSSYAGSYLHQKTSNNLSFVSDDEGSDGDKEEDRSTRSQRLGISPFSVSQPHESYYAKTEKTTSTRVPTISTRAAPSSPDDYRYSVGYGYDAGSSNNGRNADTSLSSNSSGRSTTRLSNLRANNAIIDGSNSDVNVSYDPYTNRSMTSADISNNSGSTTTDKRGGLGRLSFRTDYGAPPPSVPAEPLVTGQSIPTRAKPKKTNNNRFDRLRGMFEQKSTAQPAPIYPPGEHWQFEGHRKNPK
ncbi:hypothetical protein IV203_037631 [Nitzschia inconspicua]|uniref:Uncharacterized protein n=1 Tax=Nitzschia inconspicua TaxID=303405 RepID=A0A9K3LL46_9STRA|nr:hypothetical protein IV203_037631 [Nitzschia inconspicua]